MPSFQIHVYKLELLFVLQLSLFLSINLLQNAKTYSKRAALIINIWKPSTSKNILIHAYIFCITTIYYILASIRTTTFFLFKIIDDSGGVLNLKCIQCTIFGFSRCKYYKRLGQQYLLGEMKSHIPFT